MQGFDVFGDKIRTAWGRTQSEFSASPVPYWPNLGLDEDPLRRDVAHPKTMTNQDLYNLGKFLTPAEAQKIEKLLEKYGTSAGIETLRGG
jgi:hypothetical protein